MKKYFRSDDKNSHSEEAGRHIYVVYINYGSKIFAILSKRLDKLLRKRILYIA